MRLALAGLLLAPTLALADDVAPDPRMSLAVSLGPSTLKAGAPVERIDMAQVQLSGRYRVQPHVEFALSLVAGRDRNANDNIELAGALFDVRYRVGAGEGWSPYVSGSVGAMAIGDRDPRPAGRVGVGIEHRWSTFAVDVSAIGSYVAPDNRGVKARVPTPLSFFYSHDEVMGLELMAGGSYDF